MVVGLRREVEGDTGGRDTRREGAAGGRDVDAREAHFGVDDDEAGKRRGEE